MIKWSISNDYYHCRFITVTGISKYLLIIVVVDFINYYFYGPRWQRLFIQVSELESRWPNSLTSFSKGLAFKYSEKDSLS